MFGIGLLWLVGGVAGGVGLERACGASLYGPLISLLPLQLSYGVEPIIFAVFTLPSLIMYRPITCHPLDCRVLEHIVLFHVYHLDLYPVLDLGVNLHPVLYLSLHEFTHL